METLKNMGTIDDMETTVSLSGGEAIMSGMIEAPKAIHQLATDLWEHDTDTGFDLAHLLLGAQPGQLPYMAFTEAQLLQFVVARKLTHKLHRSTKAALMFALEDADANPIFHKWSELPPELRLCTYEHHFRDFTARQAITGPHKQPPITHVNRPTRKEALPLFYTTFVFDMRWKGQAAYVSPPGLAFPDLAAHPQSIALRDHLPTERFNSITNFRFDITVRKEDDNDDPVEVLDLIIDITSQADGSASRVQVKDLVQKDAVVDVSKGGGASPEKVQEWFEHVLAVVLSRPQEKRWLSRDFDRLTGHFAKVAQHVRLK